MGTLALAERAPQETREIAKLYKIGDRGGWDNYFSAEEYEEMTDVAERLRAPMDHTINFSERDKKLYCNSSTSGDDLLRISQKAENTAREIAKTNPQWAVEVVRRGLETGEVNDAVALPVGATMTVCSPRPDAVTTGKMNIGGYNENAMVRIWSRDNEGLSCRYISLHGDNRDALRAAMRAVGREIPMSYGSEEILATRFTFLNDEENIAERLIDGYDTELSRIYGGDFSYGRPGLNHKKALDIAAENPVRLAEHMAKIRETKWRFSGAELEEELERARYNYAAALDKTMHGEAVVSNESAGGEARASGADFGGMCAGGSAENANKANATEDAFAKLFGERWQWKRGFCRVGNCPGQQKICEIGPCAVCKDCQKLFDAGKTAAQITSFYAEKQEKTKETKRETAKRSEKKRKFGEKILNNIRRFIWSDELFASVTAVELYNGRVIDDAKIARGMYREKYDLAG